MKVKVDFKFVIPAGTELRYDPKLAIECIKDIAENRDMGLVSDISALHDMFEIVSNAILREEYKNRGIK